MILDKPREVIVHLVVVRANLLGSVFAGDGADPDIFFNGEVFEDPASFRHHHGAEFDHLCSQDIGDVASVKPDMPIADKAVFRLEQAADGPQGRGLAGAVGAQQGDDAALGYIQADTAQHLDNIVVDHFDVVDFEQPCRIVFIHKAVFLFQVNSAGLHLIVCVQQALRLPFFGTRDVRMVGRPG